MPDFKHIEAMVEDTLNSLNLVKPAGPGPFFFTRVQARLSRQKRNIWEEISLLLSKPAVAIAGICLIILINAVTVIDLKGTAPSIAEQNEPIYDEDYNMAVTSFYDFENTEP
jgi:hypothetical protein